MSKSLHWYSEDPDRESAAYQSLPLPGRVKRIKVVEKVQQLERLLWSGIKNQPRGGRLQGLLGRLMLNNVEKVFQTNPHSYKATATSLLVMMTLLLVKGIWKRSSGNQKTLTIIKGNFSCFCN